VERLRDNSWIFGLGAAVLSFPVIVLVTVHYVHEARQAFDHNWLAWLAGLCGSVGMLIACQSAYTNSRHSDYLVERAILLTGLSYGMAFMIAAVPAFFFVAFAFPGFLLDLVWVLSLWILGVTMIGLPILVLTMLWSVLYLAALGPKIETAERHSIFHADKPSVIWAIAWTALSVATLVFAIYIRL